MTQLRWETHAGLPTKSLIFSQLCEKLIECQELSAMMAHLHSTESGHADATMAHGWLGIAELLKRMRVQITKMAMGKLN